jgi:Tol biopolymer transport system component
LRRLKLATAGVIAVAVLAAGVPAAFRYWMPAPRLQPMRFAIVPPPAQSLAPSNTDRQLAISPDGTHVAYVAGAVAGTQLMIRGIDRLEAEPIRGIIAPRVPFFSPDGKWIGFFQGGLELKKVSITGGPAITICRINATPRGATWGADNTIVFATADTSTGLFSVPAGGGEPKMLTKPDASHGELDHLFPSLLPGGRAVLFTITAAGPAENAQVAVLDLETGQRKTLVRGGSHAEYVDPSTGSGQAGYLIYAAAGTLRAVRFDPARLEVLSDPMPVVDQVAMVGSGAAEFSVSRSGALVYVPGTLSGGPQAIRSLVWVNRQGREEPIKAPPRAYFALRLSPDGTRVALDIRDQENDIWIWDLVRQTLTRLTFDPTLDYFPVWTPDGRRIAFSSGAINLGNLFWQSADGTGLVERLTTAAHGQAAMSFSPDGKRLVVMEQMGKTGNDLSLLTMEGKRETAPLVQTTFTEGLAEISPDGRWLAYQSNESGQDQIYVRPFPDVNSGRWQISTAGGTKPVWASSGRELFYLDGSSALTAVPIQTTPNFIAGNPTRLFETRYLSANQARSYDVSRDGQRFLMIKESPATDQTANAMPASMVVVLNWFEELRQRVP